MLAEHQGVDEDAQMVEAEILIQVIGKERYGWVQGLGLGPTHKAHYDPTSTHFCTASTSNTGDVLLENFEQMEQRIEQLEEKYHNDCSGYGNLVSFLQIQFPGLNFPVNNIGGLTSQSQVLCSSK